jgi:hypothetical protein
LKISPLLSEPLFRGDLISYGIGKCKFLFRPRTIGAHCPGGLFLSGFELDDMIPGIGFIVTHVIPENLIWDAIGERRTRKTLLAIGSSLALFGNVLAEQAAREHYHHSPPFGFGPSGIGGADSVQMRRSCSSSATCLVILTVNNVSLVS